MIADIQKELSKGWEEIYKLDLSSVRSTIRQHGFSEVPAQYDLLTSKHDQFFYITGNKYLMRMLIDLADIKDSKVRREVIRSFKENDIVCTLFKRLTTKTDDGGIFEKTAGSSQFAVVGDALLYFLKETPELKEEFLEKKFVSQPEEKPYLGEKWSIAEWLKVNGDPPSGPYWQKDGMHKGTHFRLIKEMRKVLADADKKR